MALALGTLYLKTRAFYVPYSPSAYVLTIPVVVQNAIKKALLECQNQPYIV